MHTGSRSDARAPRIGLFINDLRRGGGETQLLRTARALQRAGYELRIFTILDPNEFGDELAGLTVRLLAPRVGPATIVNAVRELRSWRPDAVLAFLYQSTLVARFAATLARVPVIVASMRAERLETRLRTVLYRLTGFVDAATVTNSVRAAQVLEQTGTVPKGRLRIIPNAVDLHRFEPRTERPLRRELDLDEDTFLFLGIGRLAPQKDWPTLLRAVARYRGPRAHWAIAGTGALRDDTQALIDELGLADRVTLLGLRDDVPDLLAACDALVLSSTYEGLPNVVLEAMATGRPVVATDVGGCPELVTPDRGLLVPPSDDERLAEAMAELSARTAPERAAMGAAARAYVHATFSLEAAGRQWVSLFDLLLDQGERVEAHRGVDRAG